MVIGFIVLALGSGAILCAIIARTWTMRFPKEGPAPHTSYRQEDLAMHEIIAEVYAGRLNARR